MTSDTPFDPDVIAAVMRHMNDDHAADNLVIVQALGAQPDATAARMSGMTPDAIEFTADVGERSVAVAVPWPMPIVTRADVRVAVVQLFHTSCEMLDEERREADENAALEPAQASVRSSADGDRS